MPHFTARDGLELSYRELGEGRPLVLLHGFMTTGALWVDPGPAAMFAERGHRVILPDLRGHGDSARPHDAAHYPPDVLTDDGFALLDHLGLADGDYDLGGYSLGTQVVVRLLARGARPGRAIVAGQGLDALERETRGEAYRPVLTALVNQEPVDPVDKEMAYWITQLGNDPRALLNVLDTLVPTPRDVMRQFTTPALVLVGDQDGGHASADALAAVLPDARFTPVPGNHFTALTSPELAAAVVAFLG